MRLRQLPPSIVALARVAPWAPIAFTGTTGLLVIGLGEVGSGAVELRLRLAGASVAAATAWLFDDPAAVTLASSPTPLLARRGLRIAGAVALVAVWWAIAVVIAEIRAQEVPTLALSREVAALTALAVLSAFAAQRWSSDGQGGNAGAFVVISWVALSFLPSVGRLPLPPNPLQPGAAGPLLVVALGALSLALLLSRDPAERPLTVRPSRWRVTWRAHA